MARTMGRATVLNRWLDPLAAAQRSAPRLPSLGPAAGWLGQLQPARSSPSSPSPPPGPAGLGAMAAIAERIAVGTAAAAHRHRGRLIQPQFIRHPSAAEVSAIAEPAVVASAAAAELMHSSWQVQRFRAWGRGCGFRHGGSAEPVRTTEVRQRCNTPRVNSISVCRMVHPGLPYPSRDHS